MRYVGCRYGDNTAVWVAKCQVGLVAPARSEARSKREVRRSRWQESYRDLRSWNHRRSIMPKNRMLLICILGVSSNALHLQVPVPVPVPVPVLHCVYTVRLWKCYKKSCSPTYLICSFSDEFCSALIAHNKNLLDARPRASRQLEITLQGLTGELQTEAPVLSRAAPRNATRRHPAIGKQLHELPKSRDQSRNVRAVVQHEPCHISGRRVCEE